MTINQAILRREYFKAQVVYCAWVLRNPFTSSREKERAAIKRRLYIRGYSILKRFM